MADIPLEIFCKFFDTRVTWSEVKHLIKAHPQIRNRLYSCVEEIDFTNDEALVTYDYFIRDDVLPEMTPKLIANVKNNFTHLRSYYANVVTDKADNDLLNVIQDPKAKELVLTISTSITHEIFEAIIKGLISRLIKYGKDFIFVVRIDVSPGFLFKYIKGVIKIPSFTRIDSKRPGNEIINAIVEVMEDYPELFEAALGNVYYAPIHKLLVHGSIENFPNQINEVVYIGDAPRGNSIDHYSLAVEMRIQPNITMFKYPVELQEDLNNDVTTDWIVNQFKVIFPNAKQIYPVEYFLIISGEADESDREQLQSYRTRYGKFIALPGEN